MRNRAFLGLLLLSACGRSGEPSAAAPEEDGRIECRIGAARIFERFCTVEQDGPRLTVRKPDGGFRRLLIADDGRGVVAADGAEQAVVTIIDGGRIEVAIGGDIFRLPATVQP